MLIIIGILLITSIILLIIFRSKFSASDIIQILILLVLTCSIIIFGTQTSIMNKDYKLTQRAWLGPSERPAVVNIEEEKTYLRFVIFVTNHGKLPAKNVKMDKYLFIGDKKVWEVLNYETSILFPTNTILSNAQIPLDKYKDKNNEDKDARVKLNIQYEGLAGEKHKTEYVSNLSYQFIKLYLEFRKLKESDPTNPRVEELLKLIKSPPPVSIEKGAILR